MNTLVCLGLGYCAQHYVGDIGLLACKVEQGDQELEGYHVFIGGGGENRRRETFAATDDGKPVELKLDRDGSAREPL